MKNRLLSGRFLRGQAPLPGTPWSADELRGMSPGRYNFAEAMTERVDTIVQTERLYGSDRESGT